MTALYECALQHCAEVGTNIYVLSFHAPAIAAQACAGQFVNIKANDACDPLLRRPFSIYRTTGESVEIIFNIVGRGTRILAKKKQGETINALGPLGTPYTIAGDYQTAVLLSGGLGVAPMPFLTNELKRARKRIVTFAGARTKDMLALAHLENIHTATDDGSEGFHGTVTDCLADFFDSHDVAAPKIFACGPNVMLLAAAALAEKHNIPCEVSLECAMACGIGICQGCPVEMADGERKYNLVCTDGPAFDARRIKIESLISR